MFGFKNLIDVDETGFDAPTPRPSSWAVKGCRIFGEITGQRKRRTNLLMAQRHGAKGREKEWLAPMLFKGSCNAQLFEMWVEQCLMKELHEPTIVVMDNSSFHNHKRVQDILAKGYLTI
ncbi:transposase [Nitrosococcus oceani]|nr:transposase [Nitrosococcus oceani]